MASGASDGGQEVDRGGERRSDATRNSAGAAQPGQAVRACPSGPGRDLPHRVDGVLQGGDQAEARPQQADDAETEGGARGSPRPRSMASVTSLGRVAA